MSCGVHPCPVPDAQTRHRRTAPTGRCFLTPLQVAQTFVAWHGPDLHTMQTPSMRVRRGDCRCEYGLGCMSVRVRAGALVEADAGALVALTVCCRLAGFHHHFLQTHPPAHLSACLPYSVLGQGAPQRQGRAHSRCKWLEMRCGPGCRHAMPTSACVSAGISPCAGLQGT